MFDISQFQTRPSEMEEYIDAIAFSLSFSIVLQNSEHIEKETDPKNCSIVHKISKKGQNYFCALVRSCKIKAF